MDLSSILLAVVVCLGATAICVILFERLGFGSVVGFIIGPHTTGPVPFQHVDELQNVAQIGVALFLFTVGLEMRPEKVWAMRRLHRKHEAVKTSITEIAYFYRQSWRAKFFGGTYARS